MIDRYFTHWNQVNPQRYQLAGIHKNNLVAWDSGRKAAIKKCLDGSEHLVSTTLV